MVTTATLFTSVGILPPPAIDVWVSNSFRCGEAYISCRGEQEMVVRLLEYRFDQPMHIIRPAVYAGFFSKSSAHSVRNTHSLDNYFGFYTVANDTYIFARGYLAATRLKVQYSL